MTNANGQGGQDGHPPHRRSGPQDIGTMGWPVLQWWRTVPTGIVLTWTP
jgi:hypothetical protein